MGMLDDGCYCVLDSRLLLDEGGSSIVVGGGWFVWLQNKD